MVKIIFNTILGIILILVWLHFVNLGQIIAQLSKVNLFWLVPIFIFMLLSPVIRAIRLQYFLTDIKKIRLKDLIFLNGAALMLNFLIPIRMGELVKSVYLNNRYGLNLGKAVIWIFLDRFVDFLMVLTFTSVLLVIIPTKVASSLILSISVILVVALVLTYLVIYQANLAKKLVSLVKHLLVFKRLKANFEKLSIFILDSFSILRREKKELAGLGFLTFLAYSADAAIWYFTFVALGSYQQFLKMYLGQMLSALTYLIPAAPGYVGSAEASGLLILSGVFGIEPNLASAMIVLFHILSAVSAIIFGLIAILNLKIDLGEVFRKALRKGN